MRANFASLIAALVHVAPLMAPASAQTTLQYRSPAGVEYRSLPDADGKVAQAAKALAADRTNIDKIVALGTAQANESVTLTAKLTDTVRRVNFEDGQFVEKGAVLIELTNQEEEAALAEARAKNRAPLNALLNEAFAKKPTDEWVAIRPGTDAHLLFGLVHVILASGRADLGRATDLVDGLGDGRGQIGLYLLERLMPLVGGDAATRHQNGLGGGAHLARIQAQGKSQVVEHGLVGRGRVDQHIQAHR